MFQAPAQSFHLPNDLQMHDSPNGVGLAYRYITHDELMRIADCDHAMFHWVAEGWDPTRDEDSQFEQDSRNHA